VRVGFPGAWGGSSGYVIFDLETGAQTYSSNGGLIFSIESVGNGWYRCRVGNTVTIVTSSTAYIGINDNATTGTSYTGDGTSGIYVSDFQLSNSASVDPYVYNPQAAAASTAYPVLGSELITSSWSVSGTGVSQSGGVVTFSASPATDAAANTGTVVVGVGYIAEFTVSGYSGAGGVSFTNAGNSIGLVATGNGVYRQLVYATGTGAIGVRARLSTTTAVVSNISVKEVTGYTATAKGLLIEEQRTNLVTYSEDFSNAAWINTSASFNTNSAIAPDGATTADKIIIANGVQLGALTGAGVRQQPSKAATSITYTESVFAKAAEFNSVMLFMANGAGSNGGRCTFNLATGTYSSLTTFGSGFSGATASIESVGNGWYRCIFIVTSDTDTSIRSGILPVDTVATTGNGTSGIFIWGAQLEAGSFATSYIPTVASQVTRNADSASMLGDNSGGQLLRLV